MTKKEMSTGSASLDSQTELRRSQMSNSSSTMSKSVPADKERMLTYESFALAFSYPDSKFFKHFPQLTKEKEDVICEYDRLFRAKEIWLYGTEHLAKNEFQRANYLSDIMGFYRAFGLEPDKERPDSLSNELEFMYYLILKRIHVLEGSDSAEAKEKAFICLDAQKKFFTEHLFPAAKKIVEKIIAQSRSHFYIQIAKEMLKFLESEEKLFRKGT